MKRLLLDTSIIIDFLRQKQKQQTYLYMLSNEDLYVSIITHTELYAGGSVWEKTSAQNELKDLFSGITILSLEYEISCLAGKFKALHYSMSLIDCIIAATACIHTFTLVTLNMKDFVKIEGITLFDIEKAKS
ncbi:hypothetical protein COU88_02695 [Candidatus Roizmanbacteria bacterium CG10_big_fil_rev_8_21_14_0_10_39_6]|uniref:PIN domain-containing protein n=1 Tax=Candidatus Roizmanbacteria bacterium CG10_big_fil_rev_8_21_14_0_10_39_6 TaxID=1974853 RepID=A0A2M8KSI8_9BACT|nr:MAG: hypothetical protein COU88_02695 [Candidatus Roizmanbacteria bacterium CG10_big_fil_rev_8_21_14_0_10_39_6]